MNLLNKLMIALSATLFLWSCSDDNEPTDVSNATISLSTPIVQMDKNGGDATVTVTSSGDWRLSGICDWAHPSTTSGKNGDVVTFTIEPNPLGEKRVGTFKFFTGSSVALLQVESSSNFILDLLTDNNLNLSESENIVKIELNTNITDLNDITFSDDGEQWLTFDRRNDFAGKSTLVFNANKNETYKNRSTTVTIKSPLVAEAVAVNVNQKQTDAIIIETGTLIYDLTARTVSFDVRANVEYNISVIKGDNWITNQSISAPQIGDDGLSKRVVTYQLPEAPDARKGAIRVSQTNNTLSKEITIIQKDPAIQPVEIPDKTLRTLCEKKEFILQLEGNQCIILKAGLDANILTNSSDDGIYDLTGIENFPNLTTLNLGYFYGEKLDISGLHKVSSLAFEYSYAQECKEFNFGDNPITSFGVKEEYDDFYYLYSYADSFKFISSKLETLDLRADYGDYVTSIDVSECPSLTTLNANRSRKIKTLYLKTGQIIPNLIKNNVTEIIYK